MKIFNLCIDPIIEKIAEEHPCLAYCDDLLVALDENTTEEQVDKKLNEINQLYNKYGLSINKDKSRSTLTSDIEFMGAIISKKGGV